MRRKPRVLVVAAATLLGVVALTAVVIAVDGGGSTCGTEEDTAGRLGVLALARDSFALLEDSAAAADDSETSVTIALAGHGLDAEGNDVQYEFDPSLTSLAIVEDHLAALEDCPVPDEL